MSVFKCNFEGNQKDQKFFKLAILQFYKILTYYIFYLCNGSFKKEAS